MAETDKHQHHGIDYIELPAADLAESKRFYGAAFGWSFTDYGPEYAGIRVGGREVGGRIVAEPYGFPGGRRFHFADPSGNELAVWTEA